MWKKICTLIFMIGAAVLGYFMMQKNGRKKEMEYNALLAKAEALEADGYYKDAAIVYEDLLSDKPSADMEKKVVFLNQKSGDRTAFSKKADRFLSHYSDPEVSAAMVRLSMEKNDYRKAYSYLDQGLKADAENEALLALELELDGKFEKKWLDMDSVFWYAEGYILGEKDGKITVYAEEGESLFQDMDVTEVSGLFVKGKGKNKQYLWKMTVAGSAEGYYDNQGCLRASAEGFEPANVTVPIQKTGFTEYAGCAKPMDACLNPFCGESGWGYKNQSGAVVIPADLRVVSPITADGYALIRDSGAWYLIRFYRFMDGV